MGLVRSWGERRRHDDVLVHIADHLKDENASLKAQMDSHGAVS